MYKLFFLNLKIYKKNYIVDFESKKVVINKLYVFIIKVV